MYRSLHNDGRVTHSKSVQTGAAFIVMIVIMILGISAILVGSFNSATLRITREKKSSDVLAQAKEALISYAVTSDLPGSLPCPNINNVNKGEADAVVSGNCPHYVGRLPWKTLGLPDLRDSTGAPLWYALSTNFRKDSSNNHINSDSTGTISILGTPSASRVVAIIFAPGASVNGQSRSDSNVTNCTTTNSNVAESRCATNYLEGRNANSSLAAAPNTQYVSVGAGATTAGTFISGASYTITSAGSTDFTLIGAASNTVGLAFTATGAGTGTGTATPLNNEQLIYITTDNLLPNVEKRIAREIKQCLDDYAAQPSLTAPSERINKYPWAAPISPLGYIGSSGVLFGRIPDAPTITTSSQVPIDASNAGDAKIVNMLNAMSALQNAVDACQNTNNSANRNALDNAGNNLELTAQLVKNNQPTSPAITSTITNAAITAGQKAQSSTRCQKINNGSSNSVQSNLNTASTGMGALNVTVNSAQEDSSMPTTWPATCVLSSPVAPYWANWKEMVFYRVASGYTPNSARTCGPSCLSVSGNGNSSQGSGSYRAAVIVAGENLTQTARTSTSVVGYLEGANSAVSATTSLETWQATEQKTKNINDLVFCIDGKGSVQNSKCY